MASVITTVIIIVAVLTPGSRTRFQHTNVRKWKINLLNSKRIRKEIQTIDEYKKNV